MIVGKQISYTIHHIFGNMDVDSQYGGLFVDSLFIMQILEIPHNNSQEVFCKIFIYFQAVKNMVYQNITDDFTILRTSKNQILFWSFRKCCW